MSNHGGGQPADDVAAIFDPVAAPVSPPAKVTSKASTAAAAAIATRSSTRRRATPTGSPGTRARSTAQ